TSSIRRLTRRKLRQSLRRKRKKARSNSCLALKNKAALVAFVFARRFACYILMVAPLYFFTLPVSGFFYSS
ncbi:hypothetical protein, partial [Xylanibacter rodentium]|uniref:hypothetical protein n=1 Tax=Xylanibacter rodentium TaxID=2736289 RepID=UPI00259C941C